MHKLEITWEVAMKRYGLACDKLDHDGDNWTHQGKPTTIRVYITDDLVEVYAVWGRSWKDKALVEAFISTFKAPGKYDYGSTQEYMEAWAGAQTVGLENV